MTDIINLASFSIENHFNNAKIEQPKALISIPQKLVMLIVKRRKQLRKPDKLVRESPKRGNRRLATYSPSEDHSQNLGQLWSHFDSPCLLYTSDAADE